ncbi:MAG TPA: OB-fold domain-containing protein [Trebonia sp.]|nr:OB-fold domain-containing protein [Trebonia sp.]
MSAIEDEAARIKALGDSAPRAARDPVNLPAIRTWLEALGGSAPAEDTVLADDQVPPAMIQVWTMPGLHPDRSAYDPLWTMMQTLDQAGYTSIVATNCDQVYLRYLKVGEELTVRAHLLDVVGPKRTALGEGYFVTTRSTWYSGDEPVAQMDFRVLKFAPPSGSIAQLTSPERVDRAIDPRAIDPPANAVIRPQLSPDTEFFWAGTRVGELRIQHCEACGALRHPPGPMCPACGEAVGGSHVVADGTGEVYSYVVHHHPPVPGKTPPFVVALVQLPEGVRILGELLGVQPDEVEIGMPVRVSFERVDDELTLPAWRPAGPGILPTAETDVTTTFVISTALATRDYQDVHHDRDAAIQRGSKDIFLNILTTTGLVQQYVSGWAGPDAVIRSLKIRLGVPCYAGDRLTFTGRVSGDGEVKVTGSCRLGNHVTATVQLELP